MNVLVTGASGFIGTPLVEALLARGHRVIAVGRGTAPAFARDPGMRWLQRDVAASGLDMNGLEDLDAVIHLAALKEIPHGADAVALIQANEVFTVRLWNAVRVHRPRFLYASTQMVYGDPGSIRVNEEFPLAGAASTPYACSKVNSENWLRNSVRGDADCVVLRLCGFIEGGGAIDYMIDRATTGESIELFSRGAVSRDYLSLTNCVDAFLRALELPRGGYAVFNIGSGQAVSTATLATAIRDELGSSSAIVLSDKPAPRADFVFDITRARSALGFAPGDLCQAVLAHARNRAATRRAGAMRG
jgi:nucleoside-diphosphate-sugar epimerase